MRFEFGGGFFKLAAVAVGEFGFEDDEDVGLPGDLAEVVDEGLSFFGIAGGVAVGDVATSSTLRTGLAGIWKPFFENGFEAGHK